MGGWGPAPRIFQGRLFCNSLWYLIRLVSCVVVKTCRVASQLHGSVSSVETEMRHLCGRRLSHWISGTRHTLVNTLLSWSLNFFFFLVFLGPYLWTMEVPRLGVKSELQLPAYTTATAMPDPNLSAAYAIAHSNTGSLTHCRGQGSNQHPHGY